MKSVGICVCLLLLPCISFSQNPRIIDSLQKVLKDKISDKQRVDIYNKIADQYSYSDSAQVAHFASLAIKLAEKKNYGKGVAEALYNLGWVTMIKGYYTEARQLYKKTSEVSQKAGYNKGIGNALNGIAITYNDEENYSKALETYKKALKIYEQMGDEKRMAGSYNNIGVTYAHQDNYSKALEMYHKALKIIEKLGNKRAEGGGYLNIGRIHFQQGDYAQALKMNNNSLKIFEQIGEQRGVATSHKFQGEIYYRMGDYSKAIASMNRALKINEKIKNEGGKASAYYDLGKVFLAQKKLDQAQDYFEKSLMLHTALKDKNLVAETRVQLGITFYHQKKYKKALLELDQGVSTAQKIGGLAILKDGAEYLTKTYQALGQPQKALENHILFKQTADSILNEKNIKKITQLEAQYKFGKERDSLKWKQANERKLLNSKIETQKANNLVAYLGLGMTLLLLVVLGVFYRLKQRHNQQLSATNLELQESKDEIAAQRDFIANQNVTLRATQRKTSQSLKVALNIQQAILPFEEELRSIFSEYFILNKPKDVVSGDFYWVEKIYNKTFVAVVDCTGHGVPGAFMSMIGNTLLDHIIKVKGVYDPAEVLEMLNEEVSRVLKQATSKDYHGMDVAFCVLDTNQPQAIEITFAGAKRPMYYTLPGQSQIFELRGSRKSIGGILRLRKQGFTNQILTLEKGATVYLCSDGFADQNNPQRKSFGTKRFEELLVEVRQHRLVTQKQLIESRLEEFMQGEEQRDDILLMGFRV